MNLKVYSIYDVKSLVYNQPFFARANGEAVRLFQSMVNDTNRDENMISRFPEDYTLFEVSEWDNTKGELIPLQVSVPLGKGIDFLRRESNALSNGPSVQ